MYQNIFNLKIKMAKLMACYSSLFNESEKYRTYLETQKNRALDRNVTGRFRNLLIYWGLFGVLLFVKSVTAMSETTYDILYYINYFSFIGSFIANLINRHRIKEKYDSEVMDTLFGMMHLGTTMLAFNSSLERKHDKMVANLSDEDRKEYEDYLREHEGELEEISRSRYEDDEIQMIITELVHESENNLMTDECEYESITKEYLDHVNALMTDYLLEENAEELREMYKEEQECENTQVIKKTL